MPREGIVAPEDQDRFVRTAGRLGELAAGELTGMGFDIPAFTSIFVMSRITSWTSHITEQLAPQLPHPSPRFLDGPDQRGVPLRAS